MTSEPQHRRLGLLVVALGLALACNHDVDDDELEEPPVVPPRSLGKAPVVDEPFVPAGKVWSLLHGIQLPLRNKIKGMSMVDHVDVGNDAAEAAHGYSVRGLGPRIERDFGVPLDNVSYREDGRAPRAAESFVVRVVPKQDNFLIKAYDTVAAADQNVRVRIDGAPAGEWSVSTGGPNRYGEAVFPLRAAFIGARSQVRVELEAVAADAQPNAFVYWVFAKPARQLDVPLRTDVAKLWLTDRLDVGDPADERDHDYVIEGATFGGDQQFEWPGSEQPFLEDGRATARDESFEMAVIPGRDHLLVKAFDTYSKNQVVRVFVEKQLVGEWALPDGPARYGEGALRIPAELIGTRREISVRVEFVSASIEFNSFYYWIYAEPPLRHG